MVKTRWDERRRPRNRRGLRGVAVRSTVECLTTHRRLTTALAPRGGEKRTKQMRGVRIGRLEHLGVPLDPDDEAAVRGFGGLDQPVP
jgi:hypothetical protein